MSNNNSNELSNPHVFDPIHNGADECERGLTEDADVHERDEAYEERMRPRIINAPQRIWLQVGCDDEVGEIDWKELSHCDISWCDHKIHNTDIEYVRASVAAPQGEDDTAYNADAILRLRQEVIGEVERERLAKALPWVRSLVNDLIQRIYNLRRMAAPSTQPSARVAAEIPRTTYKNKRQLSGDERFKLNSALNDYLFNNCDHKHDGYPNHLACRWCALEIIAAISVPSVQPVEEEQEHPLDVAIREAEDDLRVTCPEMFAGKPISMKRESE